MLYLRRRPICFAMIAGTLVLTAGPLAADVSWKGLTWKTRGVSTTATINAQGGLDIFVVDGETPDPAYDNWNVYATLPGSMAQANRPWVEFRFLDNGGSGDGPRAYLDTNVTGQETMFQGGVHSGYSNYYVNKTIWDGTWDTQWFNRGARTAGEHSFKVGMLADGTTEVMFDGLLVGVFGPDPYFNVFETAYLGVTTYTSSTQTYTDFSYGTGYVAIPAPGAVVLGMIGFGLVGWVKRRFS